MRQINLIKNRKIVDFLIGLTLILIGVIFRIIPHQPNFTPIVTIALFGGFYFSKKISFLIVVLTMLISDLIIGFYEPLLMIFVYGSFLLCSLLGIWLKKHEKLHQIIGASTTGSLLFFVLTNFAVWAFTPWYTKTFDGLIRCYIMALPFFKNAILGDLFFTSALFGVYEIIKIGSAEKMKIVSIVSLRNFFKK